MKILVKARPRAKKELVEQLTQPALALPGAPAELLTYRVSVKEPPEDGKANAAIARALARHFGVPVHAVQLVTGATSRQKIFSIS